MEINDLRWDRWGRHQMSNGQYLRSNEFKGPEGDIIIHKNRSMLNCYYLLFEVFRPQSVFEIGVKEGGSLCLWYEVLDCRVVGVDNDVAQVSSASLKYMKGKDILVVHVDAYNPEAVSRYRIQGGADLIIDDCQHTIEQIPYNLRIHWDHVAPQGRYVIEDWKALHPTHQEQLLKEISTIVPKGIVVTVHEPMIVIVKE